MRPALLRAAVAPREQFVLMAGNQRTFTPQKNKEKGQRNKSESLQLHKQVVLALLHRICGCIHKSGSCLKLNLQDSKASVGAIRILVVCSMIHCLADFAVLQQAFHSSVPEFAPRLARISALRVGRLLVFVGPRLHWTLRSPSL